MGIALIAGGALLVAAAAAVAFRPDDVIEPAVVNELDLFSQDELDRAREYRSGQRWLFVGGLAAEGILLGSLVVGRPRRVAELLEAAGKRPLAAGAGVAAGLAVAVAVATLPFDLVARERAVDVGLSTQGLGGWATDWSKSLAITAGLSAALGAGALALMRRYGARWWLPGAGALVLVAVVFTWVVPVALAPVFNKFERLEPGPARTDVVELASQAEVDVGGIYRVDASRRTSALNAYVDGIGSTKRVVLYDTLLEELDRGERRSVIAHELGHAKGNDIPRGLLWFALSAPLALCFASRLTAELGRRRGVALGTPAVLPAFALAIAVTSLAIGAVGNSLSRTVEARADTFALELTDDPASLASLQRRFAITNLSDPDPPAILRVLFGSHPSTLERIGAARAWEAGSRP